MIEGCFGNDLEKIGDLCFGLKKTYRDIATPFGRNSRNCNVVDTFGLCNLAEERRRFCEFARGCGLAGKTKITASGDAGEDARALCDEGGRGIHEPEAVALQSADEFLRAENGADERGELPPDLKRGVLSQDALYDLLRGEQP